MVDACDPAIETDVINACDAAIAAQQDCCDTIGNGFCEGLNNDCKVDACAGANGDKTKIDEQIQAIIIDPIEAVCNNDDLIDENPLPDPLEFSCVKRTGPSVKTPGVDSSVTCQPGEVLTSCGVAGTHLLDGTYIDPASPNTCNAKTLSSSWDMKAVAVCCSFTGVTATVSTSTSTVMNGELQVVTTCPAGSAVTGCQVDIITGGMSRSGGDLRGSYAGSNAGKNTAPTSNGEADGVSTNNQCVAESQSSSTTIRGGAQCLSLSDGYEFDCVATSQYTSKSGFNGNCPTDYKLVGCMTYTPSNTLDAWYYTGSGCYVQQDNHANQYANGICCKLSQTKLPTKKVLSVSMEHKVMPNITEKDTKQSYYFESFGIVGLVLILCGGGLYWRKNKKDGYQPVKGIDSEEINPFLKDNRV